MNAQLFSEKKHGDTSRIMQITNKLATERSSKTYSECTIRQQLNGTRTLKPIVKEAAEMYYKLVQ
ncbi:MAG: hypothetical protein WCG93_16605 [Paludibacter sp.]